MLDLPVERCDAVFISDLHLHPEESLISKRFNHFITWAALNTKAVYILGDFFHVWSGDDSQDSWSRSIAEQLRGLAEQKVSLYYMHGNRDFLVGQDFAKAAGMTILAEPTVITLEDQSILLVHGDRYCTKDRGHQWFRRITRATWFTKVFLLLPLHLRIKMVMNVRHRSQRNDRKTAQQMDVVLQPMISHMKKNKVSMLIHGHTHKPGLRKHLYNGKVYKQYTLSDWDDSPKLLCYYKAKGFLFAQSDLI